MKNNSGTRVGLKAKKQATEGQVPLLGFLTAFSENPLELKRRNALHFRSHQFTLDQSC